MTKIASFLLPLILLLFTNCSGPGNSKFIAEPISLSVEPEEVSPQTQLSERIKAELNTGIFQPDIVLDFRLGMTKNEVIRQMQKLLREQKLVRRKIKTGRNALVYQLPLPRLGKIDVYFDFYYSEGKLSKVESIPQLPPNKTIEDLLTDCAEVFETKYGVPHVIFPRNNTAATCARYIWVNGNRQVELTCTNEQVLFVYSDLVALQKGITPMKEDEPAI